ncbi:hypothetical protein RclHR1_05500012 [Rhizophagus clarus]|uniref:Uncharacterized protein n=1 Tax=Rhizophagus clarus TaxID=94130 RepID=A0A2Z6SF83_9GLOM|nr:hypothetical protein RclHR1_05500012 [Rhizophagus clarus]GES80874.1 hypothetical protein GLOIN_2v1530610 [Rhizophagus clarus]
MYLIIFSYSISYSFPTTIRSIYPNFGLILKNLNMTRHNTSHTEKYLGGHRQGDSVYNNNNSMSMIWEEEMQDEQIIADETTITPKSKKKDFIEQNKQSSQSTSKSTFTKRPREDSPTTPTGRQSPAKLDKKKNYGVSSSTAHSTYSRSSEIALREEVKKLKRILLERDDWLREKEAELLEAEDVIDALQERVRAIEVRNRELQRENEIMRNYIEEEEKKKKSPANELNIFISSVMNEIRGEPASSERVNETEDHLQKENEFTNYSEERSRRN